MCIIKIFLKKGENIVQIDNCKNYTMYISYNSVYLPFYWNLIVYLPEINISWLYFSVAATRTTSVCN